MTIAFTGGNGLLCTSLKRFFLDGFFPSKSQFNINLEHTYESFFSQPFDTLVHAAAITNTTQIESNEEVTISAITTNIIATANLVKWCHKYNKKLIYISTDYVFDGSKGDYVENDALNPINKYGWTKLGGECSVRLLTNSLIIRTSFCKDSFPYNAAFNDQITTRLTVSICAEIIADVINRNITGIIHIGGDKQTVYQLAKKISPEKDIKPISILDIPNYPIPVNTSLNCNKLVDIFNNH